MAVLLYHHDPSQVPGGFLGVSLFFTLSGFLITTLLLGERERTGTVGLGRFWARRLRRLAPVGLLGLVLAAGVASVTHPDARMPEVAGDIRSAALHFSNWHFASAGVEYGDTFNLPSPVAHYWSLSIEEQFYAVYPVVALVALRRGRRALAGVLGVVVALSIWRQLGVGANRAYFGTDTRALELAVGALAAIARSRWQSIARSRWVDAAAVVSLVAFVATWLTVDLADRHLFRGGIAVHAVASAVVVVAAADGRLVAALGRLRPLVALGGCSYGVYVVHWPLYVLLDPGRTGLDGPALLAVRLAATLAVASALHVLVEQPVRRGGALPKWQAPVALATGMAVALLAATSLPHLAGDAATELAAGSPTLVTMPPGEPGASSDPTTTVAPVEPPAATAPSPASAPPTTAPPASASTVTEAPRLPAHVLVVGDSSTEFIGAGMQQWAAGTGTRVDLYYAYACTLLADGEYLIREGWVYEQTSACRDLIDGAVATARDLGVDAIVLFAGNFQVASWRPSPALPFSGLGDPAVDAPVLAALSSAVARLATAGVPVLVADLPVPAWDADAPIAGGGTLPGSGGPTINDAARVARHNALLATAVAATPGARLLPWAAILAGSDGVIGPHDRIDGLHVDPAVARDLMAGPLGDAIALLTTEAAVGV